MKNTSRPIRRSIHLFHQPWFKKIQLGILILWAALCLYHLIHLFVIQPSCHQPYSLTEHIFFEAFFPVAGVLLLLLTLQLILHLINKRFRKAFLFLFFLILITFLSGWLYIEIIFYCLGEAIGKAILAAWGSLFEAFYKFIPRKQ